MRYRRLGATGFEVSEIGFGAWGIGGSENGDVAYGPADARESKLALRRAFDVGVTFYDTSDYYGFGRSEQLIGEALNSVRQQIVVATKVGLLNASGGQNFHPDHIRSSIEGSLRRLRTSYIDLYQLHSPAIEVLDQNDRILTVMDALVREGKIRAFGISVRSPQDGLVAVNRYGFKSVQVNFHMLDQRAADKELFTLCQTRNVGVIARTPLCFGLLTGRYSDPDEFHPLDHRRNWPREQIERWAGAYRLFAPALVDADKYTPAQIALRFCLSFPAVSTVIPGMLTRQEVEENAVASGLGPFLSEELVRFREIYRSNTFFVGARD